jgi:hypothetical protein
MWLEFELDHTGKTNTLIAHPDQTTGKGLMPKQDFVFDPAGE